MFLRKLVIWDFLCCLIVLGILYNLNFSIFAPNFENSKILIFKNIWWNIQRCFKKIGQFWYLNSTCEYKNVEKHFLVAQIFLALWKSPNAQKNWAFWECLCCSIILGTLKRLEFFYFYLKKFGHFEKNHDTWIFCIIWEFVCCLRQFQAKCKGWNFLFFYIKMSMLPRKTLKTLVNKRKYGTKLISLLHLNLIPTHLSLF